MKCARSLRTFLTIFFFMLAATVESSDKNPGDGENKGSLSPSTTRCNVNLCFALDGSGSISVQLYELQKLIVDRVVRRVARRDDEFGIAAVQYGLANVPISQLTTDSGEFLTALQSSSQVRVAETFLTAGFNYCFGELFKIQGGRGNIVVLGDGRSTLGPDPEGQAELFKTTGGRVFSVGVGPNQNTTALLSLAGGDSANFFSSTRYDVMNLSVKLAHALCTEEV